MVSRGGNRFSCSIPSSEHSIGSGIREVWGPTPHRCLDHFVMFLETFVNSTCGLAGVHYPAGVLIPLFQHGVAMRGCTWAALVFMEVGQLGVKFTWMSGPEIDHMIIVIRLLSSGFKSTGQFRCGAANVASIP